jgi:sodium/potassium-transporting ATPase subunit alpha
MASGGHRVIASAQTVFLHSSYHATYAFSEPDYPQSADTFVRLVSPENPTKHHVRKAIGTLRLVGIKVMMVTSDHPKTAEAIARKINMVIGDKKATLARRTRRRVEEV